MFARNAMLTAAAHLSIALGIGANAAISNVIHTVLLRKLPKGGAAPRVAG